jgi:hypothetical protein
MPVAAAMITVTIVRAGVAMINVAAFDRCAAGADIMDRAAMTGQDVWLVASQVPGTIALEYLDDAAHGATVSP